MQYKYRPGDVVIAIETAECPGKLFGPQGREIPKGKARAHRCVVERKTHPSEAFWKGPVYSLADLGRLGQMPEAALMTEAEFEDKCAEAGIEPLYATDLVAVLTGKGMSLDEIQVDYRKRASRP